MPACWDINEKRAGNVALWSGNGWKTLRLWDHRGTCRSPLSAAAMRVSKIQEWYFMLMNAHIVLFLLLHLQHSTFCSSELSVHPEPLKSLWSRASFLTEPGIKCVRWSEKNLIMNDNGITGQRESFSLIASDWFNKSRAQNNKNRKKIGSRISPAITAKTQLPRAKQRVAAIQGASLPLQDTYNSHWIQQHLFMSCGNKMEPPIYFSQWWCSSEVSEGEACVRVWFVLSVREHLTVMMNGKNIAII